MKLRSRVISKSGSCVSTDETYNLMGQEELDRNNHPLLNDVVLTTLFKFMSKMDLKKCRLVCQKWCVLSLPAARSKFNIRLNGHSVGDEFTRRRSVTEFVEVFKHNKLGIPFANYILDPFCMTEGPGHEFLQICGSTAKTVSLVQEEPKEPYVNTVQVEDVSELLKAMTNLEFFEIFYRVHSRSGNIVKLFPGESSTKPRLPFLKKIEVYDNPAGNTKDCCPTIIEEVLSIAPNVSDFTARESGLVLNLEKSRIGEILNAIEKLKRESVIKKLYVIGGRTEHFESLQKLAKNGLKLKSLDFDLAHGEKNEKSYKFLPSLATLFKNSIERLCVEEDCTSFIQLPRMPKLQNLELHMTKDFESKCVNLKKLLPALKVVELKFFPCGWDVRDESEWEEFLPNSDPCPNVKYLSLDRAMKIQVFDHILNIFPKLTKLELDVGRDGGQILRKIMTQMTQLEKLSVNGTVDGIESIDALLTGIPDRRIRELANVAAELKEMTVQLRGETIRHYRSRHCQFPSLANLTSLKHLYLDISGRSEAREDEPRRETRLTDVFLYFCLSSMKHLNKFTTEHGWFSKTGSDIVMTEMGLKKWEMVQSIINEVE